ncbi:MAG: hypothetical protein V3U56_07165 [Syntrophobacteria bacterium]
MKTYRYWNRRLAFLVVLAVAGLLLTSLSGCAGPRKVYTTVDDLNAQGEFFQARSYVEEHAKDYGKRNRLLYLLDRGTFAFSTGDFREAIISFTEAEQLMSELYTISLSQEATTFVVNDNAAPYRGDDFESVMVNLFLALSYANLSEVDEALVEARKVDSKLTAINLQYAENEQNAYREDPFVRLLMGILYEMGQTSTDLNDAYISYIKALQGYDSEYQRFGVSFPEPLVENLLSVASFMGRAELREVQQRFPSYRFASRADRKETAEVYVLHLNGRTPIKQEDVIVVPTPDGQVVKVALPRYEKIPGRIVGARLHALPELGKEQFVADFRVAEPIGGIAIENLQNRRLRIYAKTLARVTAKYLAVREAQRSAGDEFGGLAGLLTKVTGDLLIFVSEQADLRSWRTLPQEILISKVTVPPGSYQIWAECLDASGGFVEKVEFGRRELKAGDKILMQFRTTQ